MHIVVFDKNPILSESVSLHISCVGTITAQSCSSKADLYKIIEANHPNIIILDPPHLDLDQDFDIKDFISRVWKINRGTRFIAYSFDFSRSMVVAGLSAGFHSCVSKHSSLEVLELGIAAAAKGGMFFDEKFRNSLEGISVPQDQDDMILSTREKEVLVRIARGQPIKQIASDLSISSKTVETYKARATQKLGLSDKPKIVDFVITQGWMVP